MKSINVTLGGSMTRIKGGWEVLYNLMRRSKANFEMRGHNMIARTYLVFKYMNILSFHWTQAFILQKGIIKNLRKKLRVGFLNSSLIEFMIFPNFGMLQPFKSMIIQNPKWYIFLGLPNLKFYKSLVNPKQHFQQLKATKWVMAS